MKKLLGVLLGVLLLANSASAKPKHFYQSGVFWTGVAAIGLSVALDADSTCRALPYGVDVGGSLISNCRDAKITAAAAGAFYTALHIALWDLGHNDPNRGWRTFSEWAMPAVAGGIHISAAIHNYEVAEPRTPAAIFPACKDPDHDCERAPDKEYK
jgi:hypothetical protein